MKNRKSVCFKSLFLFYFTFIPSIINCVQAQIISTIAGNGGMGYTGDGGPAVLAQLYLPNSIAVDNAGNVYTAESDYYIRKISTTGIITTIAGNGLGITSGDGGPATAASLAPGEIVIDKVGNFFISDFANCRIRKINTAGIISTIAGTGILGYSGDGGPATAAQIISRDYLAVDKNGNVYIGDDIHNVIRKINTAGIINTIAGTGIGGYSGDGGPATAAQFNHPFLSTVDSNGNLYIADVFNYRVRKIDTFGIITTIAGTGVIGYSGDGGQATAAQINQVDGIFVDTTGVIYICDARGNNCIRRIDQTGIITTFIGGPSLLGFGGDGGPATAALLNKPMFIARHGNGNFYVDDRQNNKIRMISSRPYFTHGRYQGATFCTGVTESIDTMLAANDSNSGNHEYWSLIAGPHHGTASVTYTAVSTGSTVYPSGLTYTSTAGYTGLDTFSVRITDSVISDTTTIYLNIVGMPYAGVIKGSDTVCMGHSITLTDSAPGGVWGSSNTNGFISSGLVTGMSLGLDTFTYTVTNVCGTAVASYVVRIKGCTAGTSPGLSKGEEVLRVWPNPNNGSFTVNVTANMNEDVRLIITNMLGEKVKELTMAANKSAEIKIDCPPGVYFLSAVTGDGEYNSKIVVTK